MTATFLYPSVFAAYSPNGCEGWLDAQPVRITQRYLRRWVRSSAAVTVKSAGILYSSTLGAIAYPRWPNSTPATRWTRSCSTSLRSFVSATSGRPWVSPTISSTLRPAIWPPISSRYNVSPLTMSLAGCAAVPVRSVVKPILIGACCAGVSATTRRRDATRTLSAAANGFVSMAVPPAGRWADDTMPGAMTHPLTSGRLAAAAMLAAVLVGCAAPAPMSAREGIPSGSAAAVAAAPRFAPSRPDAEVYGAAQGFPVGERTTFFTVPFLVGSHSQLDQLFEARTVPRADRASPLGRAPSEPVIQYYYQGAAADLDLYLQRNPTTGLLVARGDTILLERYQYGRNDRHRFTSWSMAKTVTAMLVGIAIAEGRIRSVDDPASAYVPGLAGTEYGRTSLRHLLQMSSGVRFTEVYSGRDDVAQLARETFLQVAPGGVEAVARFNERAVPTGTKFSYASVETQVLGLALRNVVGQPVAEYLSEKIWRAMGAEADATWLIDST